MRTVTFPIKGQYEKLQKSPGAVAYTRLNALSLVVRLVSVNRRELFEGIEALARPPLFPALWDEKNHADFREYHAELIRHLHNYLASVKTLIDHSRILVHHHYGTEALSVEFQARVEAGVAKSPLVAFVHDLRNYTLHVALPITSLRLRIGAGTSTSHPDCGLDLTLQELRRWKHWSRLGKEYLRALTANPPVLTLLASYGDVVTDLQAWLSAELDRRHRAEIQTYIDDLQKFFGVKPAQGV